MKECKFISIFLGGGSEPVKDLPVNGVYHFPNIEKAISTYLAQGYEVKQICADDTVPYIYLEKEV